jgi:hypothetical protein
MDEAITPRVFCTVVAAQLSFHQSLLDMISALLEVLKGRQLLTSEIWAEALEHAQQSEQSQNSRKSIERLASIQENEAMLSMLRDFSGTIQ